MLNSDRIKSFISANRFLPFYQIVWNQKRHYGKKFLAVLLLIVDYWNLRRKSYVMKIFVIFNGVKRESFINPMLFQQLLLVVILDGGLAWLRVIPINDFNSVSIFS